LQRNTNFAGRACRLARDKSRDGERCIQILSEIEDAEEATQVLQSKPRGLSLTCWTMWTLSEVLQEKVINEIHAALRLGPVHGTDACDARSSGRTCTSTKHDSLKQGTSATAGR
jgi:hypothetical protein